MAPPPRKALRVGKLSLVRQATPRYKRSPTYYHTMIKPFLTLLTVAALSVVAVDAKTVKLPSDDDAVASITFPEDWDVEEMEGGYGGDSADDHVYLAAVVVKDETNMNSQIDETFEMLKEHNVELDTASKKENKFKINGMEATELLFQGKDEDGPCGVSISFIPMKNNLIILTYWVTTAEEAKHQATVGKIVNSLKPAKK